MHRLSEADARTFACGGISAIVLAFACKTERDRKTSRIPLQEKKGEPDQRNQRDQRDRPDQPEARIEASLRSAGLSGYFGAAAYRKARLLLAGTGLAVGLIVGSALSPELAALLAVTGAAIGFGSLAQAVRAERDERLSALDRDLPEMLEVVALGLRSGLSFDRSFELYHEHFETTFARECTTAQRCWFLGLASREEALRDLAASYDSPLLARSVESIVRALRFGTGLAESLESAAAEARAVRKARREERIAKAPVKMMVPTGTLILPAMLILVLGPILLELIEGI